MKYLARHMPFVLVVFAVLLLGITDVAFGMETRVLITLLAPMLWLGLYVLGTHRSTPGVP